MICVDTSIWVTALADGDSIEARVLGTLLEEDRVLLPVPVRLELLAGAPRRHQSTLRDRLGAVPSAMPERATWDRVEAWVVQAVQAGQRFGMADLLIAATAADHGAQVWSADADFARLERLGCIQCFVPRV